MRFALPVTRTFVYLFGGAVAGIVVMLIVGSAIESVAGPGSVYVGKTVFTAVFFTLVVLVMCLAWALMIRSVIGFQVTVWTRIGAASRSPGIAENVARIAPPARKIGDLIILAGWMFYAFGLSIMVPVMIRDGFFS